MYSKITKIFSIFLILSCFDANTMGLIQVSDANQKLKEGIIENKLQKVKEAVQEGANINLEFEVFEGICNRYLNIDTAIFHAARRGSSEIVRYLLISGAITSIKGSELLFEVRSEDFELFKFLVEFGMNFRTKVRGISLIYHSIYNCNLRAIKLLVYYGMDLNAKCYNGKDAVWWIDIATKEIDPAFREEAEKLKLFINKHVSRMKNVKNKDLKEMVEQVNEILKNKISSKKFLPNVLSDLVTDYALYPTDSEEFFKLSDQEIDEFIKVYCDEFEKESSKCSIM